MGKARPRHLRPADFETETDRRKAQILDILRKNLEPMTRPELAEALGWTGNILSNNVNKSIDPLMLLMAEGKVGRISERPHCKYYADPDIAGLIVRTDHAKKTVIQR